MIDTLCSWTSRSNLARAHITTITGPELDVMENI